MEKLFERLNMTSNSSSSSSTKKSSKNKEILLIPDIEQSLANWKLPEISQSSIYKSTSNFLLKTDYVVKTVEQAVPIHEGFSSFRLLSEELIKKHQEKYKFLHLGMIQVAVQPATRLGLNTSSVLCVRDKRHNRFQDSLLGVIESTLGDGPIYFSCFPNYTLSLSDPHIMNSLCLDIKTDGYDMLAGAQNLILIYRIHYKAMNTVVPNLQEAATKHIMPKGVTTLFLTNLAKGNLAVPKSISWDQVNLPDAWLLEDAVPIRKDESSNVQEILERSDGNVELVFSRDRSVSIRSRPASANSYTRIPARHSVDAATPRTETPLRRTPSVIGIRRTEEVTHPVYKQESDTTPGSPTLTDMGYARSVDRLNLAVITIEPTTFEMWYEYKFSVYEQKKWKNRFDIYKCQKEGLKSFEEFVLNFMKLQGKRIPNFNDEKVIATITSAYRDYKAIDGRTLEKSKF